MLAVFFKSDQVTEWSSEGRCDESIDCLLMGGSNKNDRTLCNGDGSKHEHSGNSVRSSTAAAAERVSEPSVVLVQQLYEGFRRRRNEFVLLVEITQAEETAPVVVKQGPTASK